MNNFNSKVDKAQALGFFAGIFFANAVHIAIALPAVAMHAAQGECKSNHGQCSHHGHHPTGPLHFLAEQRTQQLKDDHELLVSIKNDLDEITKQLHDHPAGPPKPPDPPKPPEDKGPEEKEPEDKGPEPPKP